MRGVRLSNWGSLHDSKISSLQNIVLHHFVSWDAVCRLLCRVNAFDANLRNGLGEFRANDTARVVLTPPPSISIGELKANVRLESN